MVESDKVGRLLYISVQNKYRVVSHCKYARYISISICRPAIMTVITTSVKDGSIAKRTSNVELTALTLHGVPQCLPIAHLKMGKVV